MVLACACPRIGLAQEKSANVLDAIDQEVKKLMAEGDIPGLSLVIMDSGRELIRSYGYADLSTRRPVDGRTLFQLGSCSKAFTALAVRKLADSGKIKLDAYVSDYLPWFNVTFKDSLVKVTVLQLLHHTSGLSWRTIARIPEGNDKDALYRTVRNISGTELHTLPGTSFEYATVNYDILALIIEKVTHQTFEDYVQKSVINKLGLSSTTIGLPMDSSRLATGYKIGFFRPREYRAPVYRGNNAAGYIVSDAQDISRWLKLQMGIGDTTDYPSVAATHERDETVPPLNASSYAMGWFVSLKGKGEIFHNGLNPNYTSYIAFRPGQKTGLAVLANSNSSYTDLIGQTVMELLMGEKIPRRTAPDDRNDKGYSFISIMIAVYILAVLGFAGFATADIIKDRRKFQKPNAKAIGRCLLTLVTTTPFLYAVYLIPTVMAGFTWDAAIVWAPGSFGVMVWLVVCAFLISYLAYVLTIFFPRENTTVAPQVVLLSVLSGIANMIVIVLVNSAIDSETGLGYLVFYYMLAVAVYILGRRTVQISLLRFTRRMVYDTQMRLTEKILSTSFQKFEKVDKGRVYATLSTDVEFIGNSTRTIVMVATSLFTATGAFLFLISIAFWAALLTISLMLILSTVFVFVSKRVGIYYVRSRNARDGFIGHINGIVEGFKELSIQRNKKLEYQADVSQAAEEYRKSVITANTQFINAFITGDCLLVVLLGTVVFGVPKLFPEIQHYTIMRFVIILLYLMRPITDVINAVPYVVELKVVWKRIQQFMADIPATIDLALTPEPRDVVVESIRAEGIRFQYNGNSEQENFEVGPVDLEVKKGEILFIIGGNGSGKTTLAKLLTGLYEPQQGRILINNKAVKNSELSEYFSTVFSPTYLFPKLYNVDLTAREEELNSFLKLLHLEEKITLTGNKYNTINLSGGQRKRLALFQCFMENSPLYLFDEWAADQDPEYRQFFYRTLLPEMKKAGKIVIAITHDDHYFDVADKVLKMKEGQPELYTNAYVQNFARPAGLHLMS